MQVRGLYTTASAVIVLFSFLFPGWAHAADWLYTVRPGDNLWNLSDKHLVDGWRMTERVRRYNSIPNAQRVAPGSVVRIPIEWLKMQPASARLVQFQGDVQIWRADQTEHTVEAQAVLNAGSRINTGTDGFAIIEFADGSRVRIRADSELVLDGLSAYGQTGMVDSKLRLNSGRVESTVVKKSRNPSRYEISTPAAIAAVRGTDFRIGAGGEGLTRSEVTQGDIAVSGSGATTPVAAGFGTLIAQGKPPQTPRALLPAPDLTDIVNPSRVLDTAFDWPDVPGAERYRVELYADAARTQLLHEQLSTNSLAIVTSPPDGEYWLQIRAIDAVGLEGLSARRAIAIDARPSPPSLLQPTDAAKKHSEVLFRWAQVEGIAAYDMQIAGDEGFTRIVHSEQDLAAAELLFNQLPPPGTYFWRVASRAASGKVGPFSEQRQFQVLAVPDPVVGNAPEVGDEALVLSWRKAAHAQQYRYQLSFDKDFATVEAGDDIDEARLSLERPDPGTYYFRVKAISSDGVEGSYGPTQKFDVPDNFDRSFYYMFLAPLLILL